MPMIAKSIIYRAPAPTMRGPSTSPVAGPRGLIPYVISIFALGMTYSMVAPYIAFWAQYEIGLSIHEVGQLLGLTSASGIVLTLAFGYLSDRNISRYTALLVGSAAGAVGSLMYASSTRFSVVVVVGLVPMGLSAICYSQFFALVRDQISPEREMECNISARTAKLRATFTSAWAVGPIVSAILVTKYSYSAIFIAAAVAYSATFIAVLIFFPQNKSKPPSLEIPDVASTNTRQHYKLIASLVGLTLLFAAFSSNIVNLPLLVASKVKGGIANSGFLFSVPPILEIPLTIWFGRVASKVHIAKIIRSGLLLSVIYFAGLHLARTMWQFCIVQVLNAASMAIMMNAAMVSFQNLLPQRHGLATSMYANTYVLGKFIGMSIFATFLGGSGADVINDINVLLAVVAYLIISRYGIARSNKSQDVPESL